MANRQIEITIWSAGDDAHVEELAASLRAADFRVCETAKESESPDIVLVLPNRDSPNLQAACDEVCLACPGSAIVVLPSIGSEADHRSLEHHTYELLPASVEWTKLPAHLRGVLARWKRIEKLKTSAATLQHLESTIDLVYFDFRPETGVFLPSKQLRVLVGLDEPDDLMQPSPLLDRIHTDDRAVFTGTLFEAARTRTPFCIPIRITGADGRLRHFRTRGRAFGPLEDGGSTRVFGVCEDTTDHMQRLAEAEARARIDELTGLGNRRHFDDCLSTAIQRADAEREILALLYIDLDRFKLVNDTLGHEAGDQLLRVISARLQDAVRAHDVVCKDNEEPSTEARVSRLGGDEFTVLLSGIHGRADAEIVANRMLAAVSEPVEIQGQTISPAASIGIAFFPDHGVTKDDLRKHADAALYAAKASDGGFRFFEQSMEDGAIRRLSLESELRNAIDREEIQIRYQPRIDYRTDKIVGAEAMIHWKSPTLGFVAPEEVIRIATEAGFVKRLGSWTLEIACRDAISWRAHSDQPCRLAVNVSPAQFEHDDLFDTIVRSLKASGMTPDMLDLEVSESLLLRPNPSTGEALEELRRIGVGIVLDEFGKGYSALGVLMSQPLDGLKLDRRLIETVAPDGAGSQLLSNVIRMAVDLSLQPIGMGVSEADQARFLSNHGCHEMQGSFFSPPLPSAKLCEMLGSS